MTLKLDHIVYAVPDLEAGIEEARKLFGVEPTVGGSHVGRGTRNVLLALGEDCYLEIIGPDLTQSEPERPRSFGIDQITEPKLVTWAVKAFGIDEIVAKSLRAGYDPGPVEDMSRAKPDGSVLAWRLARSETAAGDGLVPFLIDWGETTPIAQTVVQGCKLVEFKGQHPEADKVRAMLAALGVDLDVEQAETAGLTSVIETPNGQVVLR